MKKLFLSLFGILILLMTVNFVSAALPVINLVSPSDGSYQSSSQNVNFTFNVTGIDTAYSCTVYDNKTGAFTAVGTDSNVANATDTTIIVSEQDVALSWYLNCSEFNNVSARSISTNYSLIIDTTPPTFTLNTYTSTGSWSTSTVVNMSFTVVDENPDYCKLDLVNSTNQIFITNSTSSVTNDSAINWQNSLSDSTGYSFNYWCNDSAGNSAYALSINRSFKVDTTSPTSPVLANFSARNMTTTDGTPTLDYSITTESNFLNYTIQISNNGTFSVNDIISYESESSKGTDTHTISQLGHDLTRYIRIVAYDEAGNSGSSGVMKITVDSICANLSSGWNLCTNVGFKDELAQINGALNLSYIQSQLGNDVTTVAKLNESHQFQSFASGGTDNAGVLINPGEVYFVYASSNVLNELVEWNLTLLTSHETDMNLTNVSTGTQIYNVVGNFDSGNDTKYLQDFDNYFNNVPSGTTIAGTQHFNVSTMSYYNNSGASNAKFVPFVGNWTINNATEVRFGEVLWVEYNPFNSTYNLQNYNISAI